MFFFLRSIHREYDMSDLTSPSPAIEYKSFDAARVESWLASQFDAAGRAVPKFEYTPRSTAYLHALATASQASTRSSQIVASDLRLNASDYRSQAVRIREILENVGLAQESLSSRAVASTQVPGDVAKLLNIKDTEMSRNWIGAESDAPAVYLLPDLILVNCVLKPMHQA